MKGWLRVKEVIFSILVSVHACVSWASASALRLLRSGFLTRKHKLTYMQKVEEAAGWGKLMGNREWSVAV